MRNDADRRRLYEECVQAHAASLYRVAYRLTGCHDLANELVQETFLNAWKDLPKLNDESKIRGWMFSILRNQYAKSGRWTKRARELTDSMVENLSVRDTTDQADACGEFQFAFDQLDDEHKLPLLLVSMEGLSVEVAAQTLGVPRGTVLSRLHRGREKLKTILTRVMGVEPRNDR
jgi:RNA polymerase sigma-70 factor (ECF subfamily)